MQKVIKKSELGSFIKELIKKYEVVAPVKGDISHFKIIKDPKEMYLDYITLMPAKEFFIPEREMLFEYKECKIVKQKEIGEKKKRIIFGMRKCDLNSVSIMDKVMFDPNYLKLRQNTTLIGLYCDNPDEHCFCNSMELIDYYDLFFYPDKDNFYISIGSKKGEALVKKLKNAKKEVILKLKNSKKLVSKDIAKDYTNKAWNTDVEKCLSCAACTAYCPTCNCFDISDIQNPDLKSGKRIRTQTSCQLKNFSTVAGGKAFRDTRASRFKHFVYHKVVYYKDKHGRPMCTGCGRCLRVCPTRIDWVNTINLIKDAEALK